MGSLASRGRGGVTHATWKTSSEPFRLYLVRLRQLPTTVINAKLKIFAAAPRRAGIAMCSYFSTGKALFSRTRPVAF